MDKDGVNALQGGEAYVNMDALAVCRLQRHPRALIKEDDVEGNGIGNVLAGGAGDQSLGGLRALLPDNDIGVLREGTGIPGDANRNILVRCLKHAERSRHTDIVGRKGHVRRVLVYRGNKGQVF